MSNQHHIISMLNKNPNIEQLNRTQRTELRTLVKGQEMYWLTYIIASYVSDDLSFHMPVDAYMVLQSVFSADNAMIQSAKEEIIKMIIHDTVSEMKYDLEAKEDVMKLANQFHIDPDDIELFEKSEAGEVISAYIDEVSVNGIVNSQDMDKIQGLYMSIPGIHITNEAVAQYKVAKQANEALNIPLRDDETCLSAASVNYLTATGRISDTGFLVITDQRIIYNGERRNKVIEKSNVSRVTNINKVMVVSTTSSGNALQFQRLAGANLDLIIADANSGTQEIVY